MATGYVVDGRGDLDALFKARTSAAAAAVGYLSNGGVDLSQRFEPRGSTTAIAATNFTKAGTDLAQIFMDIGAASDIVTNSSMVAGFGSPRTGYSAGTLGTGLAVFGSLSPSGVGVYAIENYLYNSSLAQCSLTVRRSAVQPVDTDQVFRSVSFTGIFSDSGGASVTRSVTRAGASGTTTNAFGGIYFRSWTYASNAFRFINGNTYAVSFAQSP